MKPTYLADTVALARYLEDNLPKRANDVFEKAESGLATILVPDICIAEFIYIGLKRRLKVSDPKTTIREFLDDLNSSQFLKPVGISTEGWEIFVDSTVPELHDRIIYSTAESNAAEAIITNDPEIVASKFPTIW